MYSVYIAKVATASKITPPSSLLTVKQAEFKSKGGLLHLNGNNGNARHVVLPEDLGSVVCFDLDVSPETIPVPE